MSTTSILTGLGNLANFANTVAAQAEAILSGASVADTQNLWPIQALGNVERMELAGIPKLETSYHLPFEQGRFTERPVGDAISAILTKKLDLDEKIQQYMNMNKLALDGQLSDIPRALKYAADSVAIVQQIRQFYDTQLALVTALQANVQVLLASETRMMSMIQANLNSLSNLLNEICNWGLPALPSLAARLGSLWHWNGFNFNLASGFNFNPSLGLDFNFSFSQCLVRTPDFASVFTATPATVALGNLTVGGGTLPPPIAGGDYGDPSQFDDQSYIAQMQATTAPVFDPQKITASNGTSLPSASAIISNYALPAEVYRSNIVSAVPELGPAIILPGDTDYGQATPSESRQSTLRALLIRYVNLGQIVASGFDANLTACWLQYLSLNRTGRGGQWLSNMQETYDAYIAPSVAYVSQTPVPWNTVLGGNGTHAAPASIPLLPVIQGAGAEHVLWQLSYIEAALLGYARNTTWDSAADRSFLSSFMGNDLDYASSTISTNQSSIVLGAGTASYPVACVYPQSIAGVLAECIAQATSRIAQTPGFTSSRPQFRYTFDMFAQAAPVDRFTQFWRELNANLATLLAQDSYVVGFVVSYSQALDSAIDPLADPSTYDAIETDALARNRNWTPGSVLPPIPTAVVLSSSATPPTEQSNGWNGGVFDSATYLARPDVQAQTIPVQMAMLRTNQSYATLKTLQSKVQSAVAAAVANANIVVSSISMPGWEVETENNMAVPPSGLTLSFGQVDFDQTGYVTDVQTITAQSSNPFILNATLNWDTSGKLGTRTVSILVNGQQVATASVDATSTTPYTVQVSALLILKEGDTLQVEASHSLDDPQTLLAGSAFLGLLDTNYVPQQTAPPAPSAPPPPTGSLTMITGAAFPAFTAVSDSSVGLVPVDPNASSAPSVDGVALADSTAGGASILVAAAYGALFTATGVNWTPGGLLYVAADGSLTQDYNSLATTTQWTICVGRAISATTFLYQPHLPQATNALVNSVVTAAHITATGPAPTVILNPPGAGTGATVSLQPGSNALSGVIVLQSGSSGLFAGGVVVLTLRSATFAPNRQVLTVTPGNLATVQCQTAIGASNQIDAQLNTGVGLQPNTQYVWNYTLMQI